MSSCTEEEAWCKSSSEHCVTAFIEAHNEQLYREEAWCESGSECCGSVTAFIEAQYEQFYRGGMV